MQKKSLANDLPPKQFKMTKPFNIAEKTIAVFLIIWGIFNLGILIFYFYYLWQLGAKNSLISWESISLLKIFKNYHLLFFLPLVSLSAGILLALNKKAGWIAALITFLSEGIQYLIPVYKYYFLVKGHTNLQLYGNGIISIFFLALFFILLLKPFRVKYAITRKNIIVFIVITALIVLDHLIVT